MTFLAPVVTWPGGTDVSSSRVDSYLGQGDIGDNDSVHSTWSSAKGLVLVAVRVVLVFEDLAILSFGVPGHGALADADVALGGHGGGLAAEVPITTRTPARLAIVRLYWCLEIMRHGETMSHLNLTWGDKGTSQWRKWGEIIVGGVLGLFSGGMLTIRQSGKHQT